MEEGFLIHNGWKKFQKNNQVQNGEYLVFRYDGALQFTIRIFSKNGLGKTSEVNKHGQKSTSSQYMEAASVKGQKNTLTLQNSLNRLVLKVKMTQKTYFNM